MLRLNLHMFGGNGSGSGSSGGKNKTDNQNTIKLGDEIGSSKGIKKGYEYLLISNKGEKSVRTGEKLLSHIKDKTLKYDDDIYHWVGKKGTYIIRRIIRGKK